MSDVSNEQLAKLLEKVLAQMDRMEKEIADLKASQAAVIVAASSDGYKSR